MTSIATPETPTVVIEPDADQVSTLPPEIPAEWRDEYVDLTVTRTDDGQDYLFGIDKASGNKERLSWEPLEAAVEETYGVKPQAWTEEEYNRDPEKFDAIVSAAKWKHEASKLKVENESLRLELDTLRQDMDKKILEATEPLRQRIDDLESKPGAVEKKRKRKLVASVLGGIAVGAAAVGLAWGLSSSGGHDQTEVTKQYIDSNTSALTQNIKNLEAILDPNGAEPGNTLTQLHTDLDRVNSNLQDVQHILDPNGPAPGNALTQLQTSLNHHNAALQHHIAHTTGHGPDTQESGGAVASHSESLGYRGDTIWSDVSSNLRKGLGHDPTSKQIYKATQRVLRINNLTWESARRLPVGYTYKMPSNLVAIANA